MRGGDRHADGRAASAWLVASSDERRKLRRAHAPTTLIDVAMTGSAVTAMVLLLVWFFFFADLNPLAPMMSWLAVPRDWIASFGDIAKFCARVVGEVYSLRVLKFFGESLRQAGILILGSALVIWGLAFILGLTCGIEGAYFNRSVGAPAYAGVFSAWCDLREIMPYAFGYMMSAKVGTGLVAEIGAMRISDEIDALEVMGISSS